MRKKSTISIVLVLLAVGGIPLPADDIYIAPFQVIGEDGVTDPNRLETADEIKYSALLSQALEKISTSSVVYKPLPKLSQQSYKILNRNIILTKLEASVVCFYEKIDNLLYGWIAVNSRTGTFSASFFLYEKKSNSIVKKIELTSQAQDLDAYIAKLVPTLGRDTQSLFPPPVKTNETAAAEGDKTTIVKDDATVVKDETAVKDDTAARDTAQPDKKTTALDVEAALRDEKLQKPPADKLVGGIFFAGYFFVLQHEWQNQIQPFAVLNGGINYEIPLIGSPDFDFSTRLGAFLQYSFANALPGASYVHFHSLKVKGEVELYFRVADVFGFFAGGGLFYRLDVIDFATQTTTFFTDHVFAPGVFAVLGLEVFLNQDRTFGIGVLNSLDVTLYSLSAVEYLLQLYLIFKV